MVKQEKRIKVFMPITDLLLPEKRGQFGGNYTSSGRGRIVRQCIREFILGIDKGKNDLAFHPDEASTDETHLPEPIERQISDD